VGISALYSGDALGNVDPGSRAGNTEISYGYGSGGSGFTSNHAAFTLIAVGVLGLWVVAKVFKGA
jgi:hypothetical protein